MKSIDKAMGTSDGITTIINVSNRLPVTVGDTITRSSGGLVAALEGVPAEQYRLKWLGWPGAEIADEARRQQVQRTLEQEQGCTPVWLSSDEAEGFYEGFSNSSLWPLLHYMPSYFRFEPHWWDHYRNVNRKFAERVLDITDDGDMVWVHDYQLMLLPAMLRQARPSLRVGFFLHTPFPSYEIFRCNPHRNDLVEGLLGAHLIGFHTFGYLRHFRSSVLRLLGIESEITSIRRDGHVTALGVYPIGINAAKFAETLADPSHRQRVEHFRQTFDHKQIVLSVERMDYTKGILRRLHAIDMFLAGCKPEERDRIKFISVGVPSREGVEQYQQLREAVEAQVGHINGRYATLHNSPIHFIHGSVEFADLVAMYDLADVGLVTPLMDGMNLVAKEFIASQRENPGVLVLSEFAGAAEELFSALLVNPYDAKAVAEAVRHALEMPVEERTRRLEGMRERVMSFDARAWAKSFIGELEKRSAPSAPGQPRIEEAKRRLTDAINSGQRVALFLDYDGTLREIERVPSAAAPTSAVHQLLEALLRRENLDVTIISGRVPQDLESWLARYRLGLIAEHGASLRRPGHSNWEHLDRNASYSWKEPILRVLRLYEHSTPGSMIENKRTSLVWHYRRADPEFGKWKAAELANELAAVAANEPVIVRHGRKIVEVTAQHINKGAAVMRILEEKPYDLVLCAGDDTTDESMFRLDVRNLITIKIGEGDTVAQYTIATPAAFRAFLQDACAGGRPALSTASHG